MRQNAAKRVSATDKWKVELSTDGPVVSGLNGVVAKCKRVSGGSFFDCSLGGKWFEKGKDVDK